MQSLSLACPALVELAQLIGQDFPEGLTTISAQRHDKTPLALYRRARSGLARSSSAISVAAPGSHRLATGRKLLPRSADRLFCLGPAKSRYPSDSTPQRGQ